MVKNEYSLRQKATFIYTQKIIHRKKGQMVKKGSGPGELKSHPFSVHFFDLFLSQNTDLCAEIWNN